MHCSFGVVIGLCLGPDAFLFQTRLWSNASSTAYARRYCYVQSEIQPLVSYSASSRDPKSDCSQKSLLFYADWNTVLIRSHRSHRSHRSSHYDASSAAVASSQSLVRVMTNSSPSACKLFSGKLWLFWYSSSIARAAANPPADFGPNAKFVAVLEVFCKVWLRDEGDSALVL
jgi:hypothetical protein